MTIAYQYDENGYFAGSVEAFDLLPNRAAWEEPEIKVGFIPRMVKGNWVQVENHRDKRGFIGGNPFTITEYGPLPEGWSETPPQPTIEELFDRLRSFRNARIADALWMRERHADELEIGKETSLTPDQYITLLTYIQALRDIPAQPGAPWPGGDIPWPIKPNV